MDDGHVEEGHELPGQQHGQREQGRPTDVSAQVLDAVARAPRLDTVEHRHLYRLAEATPERCWEDTTVVPDVVRELLRSLEPLPAVLVNGWLDVPAQNAAHENLFRDWHETRCLHRNLLWCCVRQALGQAAAARLRRPGAISDRAGPGGLRCPCG